MKCNAEINLKESAFAEYPFGQNNFGLLNEFYLDKIDNAKYLYERSSKHNFSLAEFNLGPIREKDKNFDKSIKYYIHASEHENEPLIYRGITRTYKRLEISKIFIIFLTNLKLAEHYFTLNISLDVFNYKESKKYFIRSFKKLEINNKNLKYTFMMKFELKDEESDDYLKNAFSYLKKFILHFPSFNLINQPNLKTKPYLNIYCKDDDKITEKRTKINHEIQNLTDELNGGEKNENSFKDKKDNNINQMLFFLSKEEESGFNIVKENERDSNERIFENPGSLFNFVISKSKIKIIFINEVREIISIINDILYTESYSILFDCITISMPQKKSEKQDLRRKINQSFYEGFNS